MSTVSTHVLDTALGRPAAGVVVTLLDPSGVVLAERSTDADGRVRDLAVAPGTYRLVFATGAYWSGSGRTGFHPRVVVEFAVTDDGHYHVPLLLSPYAYSTYRGS